ncbi:hypothetical protein QR680_011179 [Steinernema hermaphroditum]|uniref:Peptidylglycine monooxygenase n=1 Tax=Steinernema hermaphroditum TaxID=289476 RepID=A0AA39IRC7_9BILA|nr:hypothetical protein QR680_011179 [Steinernema hermaphroditum]
MWKRSVAVVVLLAAAVFGNSVRRIMTVDDNLDKFTIHMNGYSPNMNDDYVAVAMQASPGYIVKFEPFAHADRVHHMLLYGCEQPAMNSDFWKGMQTCYGASHILYAWARNAPSLTLPNDVAFAVGSEGGIRYLVLQVHYAQPFAGNVKDYSGVTLHMTQQRPANLAAVLLFVSGTPIPPGLNQFQNNMSCVYNGGPDLHPFAFRTHTHAMGRVVSAYLKHENTWTPIGKRNPQWPQLFQPIATDPVIRQGDLMAAQCRFDSHDKTKFVNMGSMGMDEMCNFYMMYYWDASKPHPFPSGGYCGDRQEEKLVANEYPVEGTTLLPKHPEWEHQAHQSAKPFGVVEKMRVSQIGQHKLGQVSGLSFDKNGNVVVFHRADKVWNQFTFDQNGVLSDKNPIARPTILVAKPDEKSLTMVAEYGSSMFYMPHGIFVDGSDNYYITDVGSHQVKKLKVQNGKLVEVFSLGTKFQPGAGKDHFCKPAGITVSKRDGSIFVADGYCNTRVVRFSKDGKYMSEFGTPSTPADRFALGAFALPHDVVIDDESSELYVTDRNNGRVQKFMVDGASLGEVRESNMVSNVYSADYSPVDGLFMIPGEIRGEPSLAVYVAPANRTQIQYSWEPSERAFQRPHILRIRGTSVWIGEIDEEGGVLWRFEIQKDDSAQMVMPNEASTGEHNMLPSMPVVNWTAENYHSTTVYVLAAGLLALFVLVCYYAAPRSLFRRDRTSQNSFDRKGFRPLRTTDLESDDDSDDDLKISAAKH